MIGHEQPEFAHTGGSGTKVVETTRGGRLMVAATVIAVGAVLAASLLSGGRSAASLPKSAEADPRCAAMARVVAGRAHSMLEGSRYRDAERQAYRVCVDDPAAFARIVRGY